MNKERPQKALNLLKDNGEIELLKAKTFRLDFGPEGTGGSNSKASHDNLYRSRSTTLQFGQNLFKSGENDLKLDTYWKDKVKILI